MIDLIRLYWKVYRLKVAIIVAALIFGTTLLVPLSDSETYVFSESLLQALASIGFYLIMTPVFMIGYYIYKTQLSNRNPGYKKELPEIFTYDNFLIVFTVYSIFGYSIGLIAEHIIFGK